MMDPVLEFPRPVSAVAASPALKSRLFLTDWPSGGYVVCCCVALLLTAGLAGGCAPFASNIVDSPLGLLEQREEILRIAPPGTSREEAIRRLEEAGVQGNAGAGPGIWYCNLWERPDKTRWHLNVAVLFDESGRVYAARAASPGVETAAAAAAPAEEAASRGGRSAGQSSSPRRSPWEPEEQSRWQDRP